MYYQGVLAVLSCNPIITTAVSSLPEYDISFTLFRMPPLILQPIIENAVKHGMDPDAAEPLIISVKTEKTDDGMDITVEDNGKGFDPSNNTETALDNIRDRLKQQCDGTMKIDSMPGKTVVILSIPCPL